MNFVQRHLVMAVVRNANSRNSEFFILKFEAWVLNVATAGLRGVDSYHEQQG